MGFFCISIDAIRLSSGASRFDPREVAVASVANVSAHCVTALESGVSGRSVLVEAPKRITLKLASGYIRAISFTARLAAFNRVTACPPL